MPVTTDIVATYRRPAQVMRRLLAMGPREDRALILVMSACVIMFVSQWPRISREAFLEGRDMQVDLAGALMGTVFILPLVFYTLGWLTHLVAKVVGGKGTFYGARLALFWALLASSPLILLYGLVAGFIGPGPSLTLVGAIWFGFFMWFWLRGLFVAETEVPA